MSGDVQVVHPGEVQDWDERISSWYDACVFHSRGWAQALEEGMGCRPVYLALRNGSGMRAMLPMMESTTWYRGARAISLPFSDYCPALTTEPHELDRLVNAALAMAPEKHWRQVEFRCALNHPAVAGATTEYIGHSLDLQVSEDQQWRMLRPDVRRAIRKSQAASLSASHDTDEQALRAFYWLQTLTRQRHGLPPQPRHFFHALKTYLLDRGMGTIVLVRRLKKPVAAALFLRFGVHGVFKYGASDATALADRPNDLAMWAGIRWCRAHGVRYLSLGKTSADHAGLRRFKRGWGARELSIPYYRYNVARSRFVPVRDYVSGWHNHIFRRLPVPVLQWAGQVLYRQMA